MSEVVEKVSAVAIETWGTQGFDIATTAFPQTTRGLEDFEGRRASSDPAKDEVPVLLRDRKTTRRRQRQLDDLGLGNGIAITERKPSWMKAHRPQQWLPSGPKDPRNLGAKYRLRRSWMPEHL